jgi:hypothetical protein
MTVYEDADHTNDVVTTRSITEIFVVLKMHLYDEYLSIRRHYKLRIMVDNEMHQG